MKPRHIAIFTQMGKGHLYPILPLCAQLAARGHRVSCPVTERYVGCIEAVGGEAVMFTETPVNEALRAENRSRAGWQTSDPRRFEVSELEWAHTCRSTEELLSQVMEFYEENLPDLVIYNRYCIAGRIVGSRCRSLAVQFSPHFAYPGRSRFWDQGIPRNPDGVAAYGLKLDSLLCAYGLPGIDHLWHLEKLNIHLIPREFQYRADLFDDRFLFAGCLLERPFEPCWKARETGKPLVLISGYSGLPETRLSSSHYFQLFIDALADTPCHCVLSIGDSASLESLGKLPTNFEVNQNASHLEILPNASILACHGGMGSSLEALHNAVPVLAIANGPYTQEVANRLVQLGAGRALPQTGLRAEAIRSTVMQMLDDASLYNSARTLQQQFRRSGSVAAITQRIRCFLEEAS